MHCELLSPSEVLSPVAVRACFSNVQLLVVLYIHLCTRKQTGFMEAVVIIIPSVFKERSISVDCFVTADLLRNDIMAFKSPAR